MRSHAIPLLLVALTARCSGSAPPPATRPTPAASPEETRETLAFLLETTGEFTGPHLGAFVLSSQP